MRQPKVKPDVDEALRTLQCDQSVFTVPNPRSLVRRVERPVDRAATALGRLTGVGRQVA